MNSNNLGTRLALACTLAFVASQCARPSAHAASPTSSTSSSSSVASGKPKLCMVEVQPGAIQYEEISGGVLRGSHLPVKPGIPEYNRTLPRILPFGGIVRGTYHDRFTDERKMLFVWRKATAAGDDLSMSWSILDVRFLGTCELGSP